MRVALPVRSSRVARDDVESGLSSTTRMRRHTAGRLSAGTDWQDLLRGVSELKQSDSPQKQFFDYAGPLFSAVVSPAASTGPLNETRKFRALPRDRLIS